MLDWREITEHIERAENLSVEDLMSELAYLRAHSPVVGRELTQYFSQKSRVITFMRTSVSDQQRQVSLLPNGTVLGVWKIVSHIGSGGMGDVYKAQRNDGLYTQIVALKVIQRSDEDSLGRFEEERKRLASLEHPGISRIIDGGATEDGHPFMVMEYHEGHQIDEYIRENKLTRPQKLRLFIELCASTTYAHSKLILHRDIKPNNVLVDASARVKLIDFGIASVIGDTADGYGSPITIAYAAPEQLMRKASSVGSDIFALGVLLHAILTGRSQQRESDGSVKINSKQLKDADLAAIISKATAFAEEERYQSVTALSDDLTAYLDTRPVVARNGTGTYRFKKLIQRNALPSVLAAGFVVALSSGMFTSLVMANKATTEAERANAELKRAEWNLKLANVHSLINGARGDAFQHVFGMDPDQQALSRRLEDYIGAANDSEVENSPEMAAAKSYVVGKHFLSRNDYLKARDIFEPWIQLDHGSPHLRAFGHAGLGFAYENLGEPKLALEMFKNAEEFYVGTPLENTIEHAAVAIQIALLSNDDVEINKARNIIDSTLETDQGPYNRSYLIGRIYKIERKHKNWEAAYIALKRQIDMIEIGHLARIASSDTSHINFAKMNFYHKQDYELAMKHIKIAQHIADNKKGQSGSVGHIYVHYAVQDWVKKDYNDALEKLSKALPIIKKHSSISANYIEALAIKGIIHADAGNYEAASQVLGQMKTELGEKSETWSHLLEIYISAREQGIENAQKLYDSPDSKKEYILGKLHQKYYLTILKKDGLKL